MATYAVGDVQGCLEPLRRVLEHARFDPAVDRLWLVGDLVNRGPASLATLRFVSGLGSAAVAVLGNHDLHLLAVALGGHRVRNKDTFHDVLEAPDRDELMEWLRRLPLVHFDADLGALMVHAGVPFMFSVEQALALSAEVQATLAGPDPKPFLHEMYGNRPEKWEANLAGFDRLRVIVNYFTRMRFIDGEGRLNLAAKEGPEHAPGGCFPWFDRLHSDFADRRIVFGHWASLDGKGAPPNCLALDTGCCWGRSMTLVRLEDNLRFQTDCV